MMTPSEVRSKRTHYKKCGTLIRGKNERQRKDFKAWKDRITVLCYIGLFYSSLGMFLTQEEN